MKSGRRAGSRGYGGSKWDVGVLTRQIGSMPVRSTKFSRDLSSYGRAPALQAGEIGSTPIGSTNLASGLVADAVSAAV